MQKARYAPVNLGHFGLAAPYYTHFTSPIRRYPDLVVHRLLRASGTGTLDEAAREELTRTCLRSARHTSEMERRADEAERELVQWKKVRFMADKVGDEFDGYITGVAAFGLFIELVDHFVEGMVHISSMADDYYRFLESTHTLRGENTHKVYRLGDRVRVQVVRVDLERRQIDLGPEPRSSTPCAKTSTAGRSRSKAKPKPEASRNARQARASARGKRDAKSFSGSEAAQPAERRLAARSASR